MRKTSIFRRIARSAKAIVFAEEKADTQKRIEFAQKQVARRVSRKKKIVREEGYRMMMSDTGMTQEELRLKLQRLRETGITLITFYWYRVFGLYRMSGEEAMRTLQLMKEAADLEGGIKWDLRQIDLGRKTYPDIEAGMDEFRKRMAELLTPEAKIEIAAKAGYLHPEAMDEGERDALAADMEATRRALNYDYNEYAAFHFYDKSTAERREFIGDAEKRKILRYINSEESIGILDDKLMTYERLGEFFGRGMVYIGSEKDWFRFRSFFRKNDEAVVKPRFESLGKGIRLIRRSEAGDLRKLFIELIDEHRRFLLEGYIHSAEEIKALNPDSVNTVRIISYFDGTDTSIRSSSIRIGHAGSFTDNVGSGGITALVDAESGVIISDGTDDLGIRYETHPDTGVRLKGYQLPAWDKAIETVRAVSGKIDGARYIGWDLACTSDYEWVIVEGNSKTGFFGAQAPTGTGRRREFFETTGRDPADPLFCEITLMMAEELLDEEGTAVETTMERLKHFESLGLDGRHFRPGRVWELTDEECISLYKEQ